MTALASIDFETRSSVDLRRTGVDVYSEHPHTGIWCMAWCIGDGPIELWRPGDRDPDALLEHIDGGGLVSAWNSPFEAAIWSRVIPRVCPGWPQVKADQWSCTMSRALTFALPGALEKCALAMNVPAKKDMAGHRIMLKLCKPTLAWRKNPVGEPAWYGTPAELETLGQYCMNDVHVERLLAAKIKPLSDAERAVWILDQRINQRGVRIDRTAVQAAMRVAETETRKLNRELAAITGGTVKQATNAAKLLQWLRAGGVALPDLRKRTVAIALADLTPGDPRRRALEIRQQVGKASTKKLRPMLESCNSDGRARGLFAYHVATTGRWAGRRIQLQNMPRPILTPREIEDVIGLLQIPHGADAIRFGYADPMDAIASSLRGMLVPEPGHMIVAGDLANIEGRVLAWLAGEQWKLDAFRAYDEKRGPDLYRLAYGRSFGVDPNHITDEQRQIGKVQELACGYQGGPGAYVSMAANYNADLAAIAETVFETTHPGDWKDAEDRYPGAEDAFGLSQFTWTGLRIVVDAWREAHPAIEFFWSDLEACAMDAILSAGDVFVTKTRLIRFASNGRFLFAQLPSGRILAYARPSVVEVQKKSGKGTKSQIQFYGQGKKSKKWEARKAYGGLLAENVVQATSRDILACAMQRIDPVFPIIMHVHDEIVSEVPAARADAEAFNDLLCAPEPWMQGLPIKAKSYAATRYQKD